MATQQQRDAILRWMNSDAFARLPVREQREKRTRIMGYAGRDPWTMLTREERRQVMWYAEPTFA